MMTEDEIADLVTAVQQGDFNVIKDALRRRVANNTASLRDSQNCTLLHWAAINNRYAIANLLIDSGAQVNASGGVLEETPLMWAIRRKFYSMVDLLIRKGGAEMLAHKGKSGDDALSLAFKLGDYNMIFLLLHWGCNPNSIVSAEGDTPLLALFKTNEGPTHVNIDYVRLLLRFGADPSIPDIHGNNCLHVLAAHHPREPNLLNSFIVHEIYEFGGIAMASAKNKAGQTPYQVSKSVFNGKMTSMLFDEMLFHALPYYIPTAVCAAGYLSLYALVQRYGLVLGCIASALLFALVFQMCTQWTVMPHRTRVPLGFVCGMYVVVVYSYYAHFQQHLSLRSNAIMFTLAALCMYLAAYFHVKRPGAVKPVSKSTLVSQIIQSSPKEGTYEEYNSHIIDGTVDAIEELDSPPIICTVCLVDKYKNAGHCRLCGYCILDKDQHVEYLGVCTGRGNMRVFLFFLIAHLVACISYVLVAFWVHSNAFCPEERGLFWNIFAVEWCMIRIRPHLFGPFLALLLCIPCFFNALNQHCAIIAWETTLQNAYIQNHMYVNKRITLKKALSNILSLCLTGVHKIVTPDLLAEDEELVELTRQKNRFSSDGGSEGSSNSSSSSTSKRALPRALANSGAEQMDVVEVNWADDDELRPSRSQNRNARLNELGSPYHSTGRQGHAHSADGKCCQHDHGAAIKATNEMTTPLRSISINIDDRA